MGGADSTDIVVYTLALLTSTVNDVIITAVAVQVPGEISSAEASLPVAKTTETLSSVSYVIILLSVIIILVFVFHTSLQMFHT